MRNKPSYKHPHYVRLAKVCFVFYVYQIYLFFFLQIIKVYLNLETILKTILIKLHAKNSPDRNENPCEGWRLALTRIVVYSGRRLDKKRNRSAPKNKY